jgi:hypothetical protein
MRGTAVPRRVGRGNGSEIDASNLPGENDLAASLEPTSPTVILDAETGERVAHMAELDRVDLPAFPEDPTQRSFYLRPATRLREDARYLVAIRDLRRVDGTAVEPTDYFRALRDDIPSNDPDLEARRPAFEALFDDLAAAGVERSSLLQAWSFHTASGPSLWGDLVAVRQAALEAVGAEGLGCTVTSVEEPPVEENASIFREVRGTFTVPLYNDTPLPGARLVRDAEGRPMQNGTAEAPFLLVIPRSVAASDPAGPRLRPGAVSLSREGWRLNFAEDAICCLGGSRLDETRGPLSFLSA